MKLPFQIDLNGKVTVITGAGGVLMSEFARALAASGAKVALLHVHAESAQAVAASIGVAVIIYGVLIVALKAIDRNDLALMPKGEKIAKLLRL